MRSYIAVGRCMLLASVFVAAASPPAAAGIVFTAVDLGGLGSDPQSYGCGINSLGQVVGVSVGGHWSVFLWENGVKTELMPLPGDLHTYSNGGMNEAGDVAGRSASAAAPDVPRPVLWRKIGGAYVSIALPILGPGLRSMAEAVDAAGDKVVGGSDSTPGTGVALLWTWNGSSWVTTQLPGGPADVKGINDAGTVICGDRSQPTPTSACVWALSGGNWVMTMLNNPYSNTVNSYTSGLNAAGDKAAGIASDTSGQSHPMLWEYNGTSWSARVLSIPSGGSQAEAWGISPNGNHIVGTYLGGSGSWYACLWEKSGSDYVAYDLMALISEPGWYLRQASHVNDNGWIVGYGTHNSEILHGFLLQGTYDSQPPSVPTNVVATAQSCVSIRVTWTASTDNKGVEGYKVFRNGSQVGTSATTSYTDTGLLSDTTYSYAVSAYDAVGNESAQSSPPATAKTFLDITPPSVPSGVTATTLSCTSIRVGWSVSTDDVRVIGYKIYRNGVYRSARMTTSYTDTSLLPNTTYSYTVLAYDAAGNTSAQSSPPATARTLPLDTQPPSVPTNVQASAQSPYTIKVTWTAATDNVGVTGYRIYADGIQVGTSARTEYTATGLTPGVTYAYTVSAYDATGNASAQSSPPATATATDGIFDLGVLSTGNPYSEACDLTGLLNPESPTMRVYIGGSSRNSSGKTHPVRWEGSWSKPTYWLMTIAGPVDTDTGLGSDAYAKGISGDGSRIISDKAAVYKYSGGWTKTNLGGTSPAGYDINPAGDRSVGSIAGGTPADGAVWTWNGSSWSSPTDLGNAGVAGSVACATSGSDRICGYRYKSSMDCYQGLTWKWDGGAWAAEWLFGDLVTGGRTYARGISPDGTKVVGESGQQAYVWEWSGSSWTGMNLGTLSGGSASAAYGINSSGQVVGYAYSGGQQRAVRWTKNGSSWTIQDLNSLLAPGSGWVLVDAKAVNDAGWVVGYGTKSGATHAFFLMMPDTQSPSVPMNVTAAGQTSSSVQVTWSASTDNTGVMGYAVYRNGVEVGTSLATSYTDIGLTPSTTYYYAVSAYDVSGNSSAQSSPPATATTMTAISIAAAKQLPDSSSVGMVGKIVTAIYSDCFYVEEPDRNVGIKVVPVQMPSGLATGAAVTVGGTMQTADGERYIANAVVF